MVLFGIVNTGVCTAATPGRMFIAHRGVNLGCTVAGENSLEAVALARAAGFGAVETDVRLSADSVLVVMHDADLNRTCLNADGSEIGAPAPVAAYTLAELRSRFCLRADSADMRSRIPTLAEYLSACRSHGLFTFIEPKLVDPSGRFYARIIALADSLLGRDAYIITSNHQANRIIRRDMAVHDVRLMDILYQTTVDDFSTLGNAVMAISTSRFSPEEHAAHATYAKARGIATESHADKFQRMRMVDAAPIDYVSTDRLAPDTIPAPERPSGRLRAVRIVMEASGPVDVEMCGERFTAPAGRTVYGCLTADPAPQVSVTPRDGAVITSLQTITHSL